MWENSKLKIDYLPYCPLCNPLNPLSLSPIFTSAVLTCGCIWTSSTIFTSTSPAPSTPPDGTSTSASIDKPLAATSLSETSGFLLPPNLGKEKCIEGKLKLLFLVTGLRPDGSSSGRDKLLSLGRLLHWDDPVKSVSDMFTFSCRSILFSLKQCHDELIA